MKNITKKQTNLITLAYIVVLSALYFLTKGHTPTSFGWHVHNFVILATLIFLVASVIVRSQSNEDEERKLTEINKVREEIANQVVRVNNDQTRDEHAKIVDLGKIHRARYREVQSLNGILGSLKSELKPRNIIGSYAFISTVLILLTLCYAIPFAELYVNDIFSSGALLILILLLSANSLITGLYTINQTRGLRERVNQTEQITLPKDSPWL
jgi:hypothetical protein